MLDPASPGQETLRLCVVSLLYVMFCRLADLPCLSLVLCELSLYLAWTHMGVSKNRGKPPKWMFYVMKKDDLGG